MEKRSEIIRETLSLKLQGCWGDAKRPLPKNKTRSLTYCYKNERSAISKQPKSASQTPHFAPFPRYAKLHKPYHIDYLYIVNNILHFCVFVFLCFEF